VARLSRGSYHRRVQRTSWLTLVALSAIIAIVVGSSLQTGGVRCEVCIDFRARSACRSVDGATESDARMAATTNVCALLASGVTDTMACQRTTPRRSECRATSETDG